MTDRLILSLDMNDDKKIRWLVDQLQDVVKVYKIGAIPFTHFGPALVDYVKNKGLQVMLDLKYHDIPNTVARACEGAQRLGADLVTLHTSGGFPMLEEAVKAVSLASTQNGTKRSRLLGITVLTSIDEALFKDLFGNVARSLREQVLFLARLAQSAGLDGVVASPLEIKAIRQACGKDLLIVTPGIRSADEPLDDQARTMTAAAATKAGADYLVVGRPIVKAADPVKAAEKILKEMNDAS